jgi:capsular polysaccharide transport system permease protein
MSLQFLDSAKATNIKARVVESINNLKSNKIWSNKLFLATVVVPTALSILYFGPIASDVYITESKFVVRSPQKSSPLSMGDVFGKIGFSKSDDDSYSVRDYITSRDALNTLNQEIKIKDIYSQSSIDVFNRYPGLKFWDNSLERFHSYYLEHIGVQVDGSSSISTLTVRAYTAEDATKINQRLVDMSEALVNRLNERARQDLIKTANSEVSVAKNKLEMISQELTKLRSQKTNHEPEKQVSKLQSLALERDFADKQLATALASLEQARTEALRKQLYIERVVQASQPDKAMEPRRIKGIFTTFILGLIAWGVLSLMISGIKEHHA